MKLTEIDSSKVLAGKEHVNHEWGDFFAHIQEVVKLRHIAPVCSTVLARK